MRHSGVDNYFSWVSSFIFILVQRNFSQQTRSQVPAAFLIVIRASFRSSVRRLKPLCLALALALVLLTLALALALALAMALALALAPVPPPPSWFQFQLNSQHC